MESSPRRLKQKWQLPARLLGGKVILEKQKNTCRIWPVEAVKMGLVIGYGMTYYKVMTDLAILQESSDLLMVKWIPSPIWFASIYCWNHEDSSDAI